jgi:hypothetical protein
MKRGPRARAERGVSSGVLWVRPSRSNAVRTGGASARQRTNDPIIRGRTGVDASPSHYPGAEKQRKSNFKYANSNF